MKSFTPPPEYTEETDSDEYTYTSDSEYTSDDGDDSESGLVRSGSRVQDEFLTQVGEGGEERRGDGGRGRGGVGHAGFALRSGRYQKACMYVCVYKCTYHSPDHRSPLLQKVFLS